MHSHTKHIFGAFFITLLLLACIWDQGAMAAPAAAPPLEISVQEEGFALEHFDQDVARLRQLASTFHAASIKFDCGWNNVEGEEGKYNFWYVDYMCRVATAAHVKVKLIANNSWAVPSWLWRHKDKEPFALNADGQTGRQGRSADSTIGKYPAPVLLAYSNPWVRAQIRAWQGALVRHVEQQYPGLANEYICEGEIYLNPDNDTGNLLFDYNPWTIRMFRTWLQNNSASPYSGDLTPGRAKSSGRVSLNRRWQTNYGQWAQVQPPRVFKANSSSTRDWCAFLQWYVAWSYAQVASGLRAQTHLPITFLLNTFTGVPMPNDHVFGPSRTQDEYWLIFKMAAPSVTNLGVTAYPYDPGWETDASGQWETSLTFLSTCGRLLRRPVQIVEGGGTTMHVRTLSDLRWQLFSAYSHNLAGLSLGCFDLPEGVYCNYSWNPALGFSETQALCRSYATTPRASSLPAPRVAVLYDSSGELLAPGDGTEARCVRAIGRVLRDAHYAFDVLDTRMLDDHATSLQAYRAVFLPSGVALSPQTRHALQQFHQAGGLMLLGDQAGSRDLWGSPTPSLFSLSGKNTGRLIRLESQTLAAAQAQVEQTGIASGPNPSWLEILGKSLRPALNASPALAVSARLPRILFNRSAEQTVRVPLPGGKTRTSSPGQELPAQAHAASSPIVHPVDSAAPLSDLQSWTPFGILRPTAQHGQNGGFVLSIPPLQASGISETGLRHAVTDLSNADTLSLSFMLGGEKLPRWTHILVRLSSSQTGRAYEVEVPYPTQGEQTMSYSLARDFKIASLARRQEIDQIALVVSGVGWPRLDWNVDRIVFQPAPPSIPK